MNVTKEMARDAADFLKSTDDRYCDSDGPWQSKDYRDTLETLVTYITQLEQRVKALEENITRKDKWIQRAESELEKIELIKMTGMMFKSEMECLVNKAVLALQAALAGGKEGV